MATNGSATWLKPTSKKNKRKAEAVAAAEQQQQEQEAEEQQHMTGAGEEEEAQQPKKKQRKQLEDGELEGGKKKRAKKAAAAVTAVQGEEEDVGEPVVATAAPEDEDGEIVEPVAKKAKKAKATQQAPRAKAAAAQPEPKPKAPQHAAAAKKVVAAKKDGEGEDEDEDDEEDDQGGDFTAAMSERQKRRREKKMQKLVLKRQKEVPELVLGDEGKDGIKVKDLRDLILWVLADGVNTNWLLVKNKNNVNSMVVVMINGLYKELVESRIAVLPNLMATSFIGPVVSMAPGTSNRIHSSLQTLLQVPLSNTQKRKREEAAATQPPKPPTPGPTRLTGKRVIEPTALLASAEELRENNYILLQDRDKHAKEIEGYAATNGTIGPTDGLNVYVNMYPQPKGEQILSIDCEMCRTAKGLELTRVSVVNDQMQVLYDSFVLPVEPIIDYNTRWSGITAETLLNVRTRIEQVQEKLIQLITPETILVGHSLENDLKALKIFHDKVIDTALVFEHPRGPPAKPSLRYLTERFLKRVIQDSDQGHDSIEDARATMQLVLFKLEHGFEQVEEAPEDVESLFKRLHKSNKKSALVDTPQITRANTKMFADAFAATHDDQVVDKIGKAVHDHHFILSRLTEFENYMKNIEQSHSEIDQDRVTELLANADKRIAKIRASLQPNTLLVVVSGHGDMTEARRLIAQQPQTRTYNNGNPGKQQNQKGSNNNNSNAQKPSDPALEAAIKRGRAGITFFEMITAASATTAAATTAKLLSAAKGLAEEDDDDLAEDGQDEDDE